MIRSMTGYGKATLVRPNCQITVEIKSINHKFFDLSARLPDAFKFFEDRIKDYMHTRVARGRIALFASCDRGINSKRNLEIDTDLGRFYFAQLNKLRRTLGIKEGIKLNDILGLPDVIRYKERVQDLEKFWPALKVTIDKALAKLLESKSKEGRHIYKDLITRVRYIETSLDTIAKRSPKIIKIYKNRLKTRTTELLNRPLDKGRLEEEVALFAKNCDIQEELTRVRSHIKIFKEALLKREEAGRYLDFISQELNREVNTIASKACDFQIQKQVLGMKSEIDKIREQIQNVE